MPYYVSIAVAILIGWYANNLSRQQAEDFISGSGSQDKETVRPGSGLFFDRIAPTYDMLNEMISLGHQTKWRRTAINKILPVTSVLDVSTGTGDLAISIAANHSIHVVALDPSAEMLGQAEKKIKAAGGAIGDIQLVTGSVEALPFEDGSFEAAIVAFGVRNFEDRQRGLSEIARVLAPEGKLAILEISSPAGEGPFRSFSRFIVKRVLLSLAGLISGDMSAYRYLGQSMDEFPCREEFESLLTTAGFVVNSYERLGPFGCGPELYYASKEICKVRNTR